MPMKIIPSRSVDEAVSEKSMSDYMERRYGDHIEKANRKSLGYWKDLHNIYRIGSVLCLTISVAIVIFMIAYHGPALISMYL